MRRRCWSWREAEVPSAGCQVISVPEYRQSCRCSQSGAGMPLLLTKKPPALAGGGFGKLMGDEISPFLDLVRSDFGWLDVHTTTVAVEVDVAGDAGVDGVVLAEVNIQAGVPLGATLTNDDVAGDDDFATELFHAEALGVRIATVLDGALSFFMGHGIGKLGGELKRSS